jgi:hypothetical protein
MSLIFNPTSLYMQPNNQAVDVSKDVEFSFIFQGYELNSARLNLYRQNTSGKWVTINNDWYDFTLDGTKYNGDVVSSSFNLTNMLDYYGSNLGWRLEVYGYELTCNQDTQTPDDNSFPYNASGIETGDAFSFNVDGVRTLYYINIFSGNRMRFYTNREAALQNSNLNVVTYNKISGKIGKAYGVSPLVPLVLIIPPLLKLNVPSPITVPNYEFVPTWQYFGATQTIVIKHWKATLYNDSGKEIDTSGDVYNGNLKYTFQTLLLSDNSYKVEYEVYDNNGYYYSTGLVDVKVFYETATSNFVPTLEVDCYDTSMEVDWSGAHNVRGVLSKGEPEYLDDYIVDGNYGLRLPKDVSLTYDVDMPQNQMPTFVWEPGSVNYDGEIVRFTSDTQELIVSYNNSTKTLYYTLNIKGTSYSYRSNISTEFSLKDKGTYLIGFYGNNGYIREVQTNQYVWFNVEGYVLQPTLAKQRSPEQMVVEGNVEKHEPTTYQAYVTPDNPLQLVSNVNPNTSNNHGALPTSETKQNLFTPWINKYAEGVSEAPTTIPCRNTEYNWFSRKGIFVNIMIDPSLGYVLGYHRFLTPIPQGKKIYVHFGAGGQPYSVRMYFTNDERTLKELYKASDDVGEVYDGSFTNSENYKYFVMDFTPQNSLNSMTISDVYVGLDEWDSEANYLPPFKDICVELATIGTTNIKVLGQANISCKDLTFSNYIETPNTEAYNQVLFTHPQITSIMYHINNEYCEYPLLSNMFENIFYASQKPKQDYPFTIAKSVKYRNLNVNALTLSFPKTFGDLDSIASYIKNNKNTNLQLIYPRKIENVEYQRTNDNKNTKDVGQTFRPSAYPSIFNVGDVVFPQNTLKIINSGRNTFDVSKHQGSSTSWDVSQQAYSHDGNAIVDMEDMWNLYKTIDKPMHLTFDAKMNVDGNLMISSSGSKEKQFVGTDVIRVGQNYQRFNVKIDKFTKRNDEGLNNGSELLFSDKDSIDVARINTPNGEANLFDYTKFNTQTLNGVTITNLNNGAFKIDGTPTSNNVAFPYWNISHDEFVKMFKPGMLILKGQTTNPSLFVQIFKSDSLIAQVVLRDGMIDTNDSIVISDAWLSDTSVTARMLFSYANTSSFKGGFTRPILYQPNSQKASITKNLFDKNDIVSGIRVDANGLVDATNAQTSNYIEVQPNTQYYLTNVIGLSTWFTGGYFDKDKKFISQLNVSGRFPTSGAITTPSNCYYIVLNILVNNNLVNVDETMMSLGSTPIDYESFKTIEVVDYEIVDDDMTYPQISMNVDGDYEQVTTQGYQLFDASKLFSTKSQGGATVMNNGDGSFTISGSGNLSEGFAHAYTHTHEETLKMLKVGKITLNPNGDTYPRIVVQLLKSDGNPFFQLTGTNRSTSVTPKMLQDVGCRLQMIISGLSGQAIKAGTIKPMVWQEKNLFDYTKIPYKAVGDTSGGNSVTLFNNQDGSFTIAGKNLFNVNGNVNVKGYDNSQVNSNTVKDGILTCGVNRNTSHAVGQRLYGLKGKTISINAKLKSFGTGTGGYIFIYDGGGEPKRNGGIAVLDTLFAINNYTCQTDDIVIGFSTAGGTGAQFYDIMVSYGAASANYVAFDTPVTLSRGFASDILNWDNNTLKQKLKAGTITLDALSKSLPYFEALLTQGGSGKQALFNTASATMSKTINQEWLDANDTAFRFGFYNNPNQLSTPTVVYPIVYQPYDGTWEPFTGGEPSPSPSYAQEPKFIGDIGQNLFDASKLPTKSQGGATVTNNGDGSFTVSGSGNLSGIFQLLVELTTEKTKKILKQGNLYIKTGQTCYPYFTIAIFNSDGSISKSFANINSANGVIKVEPSYLEDDTIKLKFGFYGASGANIVNNSIKPMLYQDGDGTYRPFSEAPKYYLDVNAQSDNLLNGDYFYNYCLNYLIQNSSGALNAISKKQYRGRNCLYVDATSSILRDCQFLKNRFKPNTRYYINITMLSYDASKPNQTGLYVRVIYTDGTRLLIGVPNEDRFNSTFVSSDPNKSISYIDLSYAYHSVGYIDLDNSFICEEAIYKKSIIDNASIDLDQPLRALPNGVGDYITQDDKVIRNVGEITFDGSSDENWALGVSYGEKYARFSTSAPNLVTSPYKVGNVICDKFPYRPYESADVQPDNEYIIAGSGYIYVLIEKSRLSESTAQGFKTWLQSNPITVWYELATPTTNELTDEQKQQWHSLQRFSDKTHIYGNFKTSMIEYNQGLRSGVLPKVSVKNISMSTDANILYEPYNAQKINVANIQLNKLYNDNELSSSGIFDSVDLEKALFTQYIKLTSFTTPTSIVSGVGVDYVVIPKPSDYSGYGNTTKGAVMGDSFRSSNSTTLIDYEEFVLYTRYNSNSFYLSVPKGMGMDLIKNYLLNRQYYYTLTNPITLNIGSKLGQQWEDFKLNAGMNTIYDDSDNGVYPYLYLTYRDSAQTS